MKKIISTISLLLMCAASGIHAQTIASFQETGAGGDLSGNYPIDFINDSITGITLTADANLDTAVLALGPGATAGTAGGSLGFANAGAASTLTEAISSDVYQSFTLTPAAGFQISVSGLTFNADAGNTSSTFNFNLLSSLTGFTESDSLGTFSVINGAAVTTTLDTSVITALQDVASTIEFRIYLDRSVGGGTTAYYADDGVNGGLFSINGTVEAIPEPSTYALLALGAAGLGAHLMRRRRRR